MGSILAKHEALAHDLVSTDTERERLPKQRTHGVSKQVF